MWVAWVLKLHACVRTDLRFSDTHAADAVAYAQMLLRSWTHSIRCCLPPPPPPTPVSIEEALRIALPSANLPPSLCADLLIDESEDVAGCAIDLHACSLPQRPAS